MTRVLIVLVSLLVCCGRSLAISSHSPWGTVATWPASGTETEKLRSYDEQLDSIVSAGISWVKPTYSPLHLIQRPNATDWQQESVDSLVVAVNRHKLNLLGITWPHPDIVEPSGWRDFWNRVVERYDGDNVNDMPGLTNPIKYWHICLEPGGFTSAPWRKDKDPASAYPINTVLDSVARYIGIAWPWDYTSRYPAYLVFRNNPHMDTLWNPRVYEPSMTLFYDYIRVSANTIHQQDPTARVCAPGWCDAMGPWRALVKDSCGTVGIVQFCCPPPPYHLLPPPKPGWPERGSWLSFLENIGDFLDIVTVNIFPMMADTFEFAMFDSIRAWCDGNYGGENERPIWLTEVGWDINPVMVATQCSHEAALDTIADLYQHLFAGWNRRTGVGKEDGKLFFWTFADHGCENEHWGVCDSALGPRPARDAIRAITHQWTGPGQED